MNMALKLHERFTKDLLDFNKAQINSYSKEKLIYFLKEFD
jgi:hypothetical protein